MTNYSVVCAKLGRVIKARIIDARARASDLVYQRSWIVCVSVCVSKTRSKYALNSQGPVRTNNFTRTLLLVRMCNSTKFLLYFIVLHLGPTKFIRPLLMDKFSEFSNLQIYRK